LVKAVELSKEYTSSDPSHGLDHTKRVLRLIEYIVEKEELRQKVNLESLKLATILHDLGSGYQIRELKESKDKFKSGEHLEHSLKIAGNFLREEKVSETQIEKIKDIIAAHGTHGSEGTIEGNILHDADLLDGIGLVGVLRKFTYGGQIGRDILGSLEFTKGKIKNRKFRTTTGRSLGRKRIERVRAWLEKLEEELEGRDFL